MPEISLDSLSAGREGVRIDSIELRRTTSGITDEQLTAAGLEGALTDLVFALPADLHDKATICHVRLKRTDDRHQWTVFWQWIRGSVEDIPEDVHKESAAVGGMAGLEERISGLWANSTGTNLMVVTYALTAARRAMSKLMRANSVTVSDATVRQVGSYWEVTGSPPSDRDFLRPGVAEEHNGYCGIQALGHGMAGCCCARARNLACC